MSFQESIFMMGSTSSLRIDVVPGRVDGHPSFLNTANIHKVTDDNCAIGTEQQKGVQLRSPKSTSVRHTRLRAQVLAVGIVCHHFWFL